MKLGKSIDDGDTIGEKGLEFSRFQSSKKQCLTLFRNFQRCGVKTEMVICSNLIPNHLTNVQYALPTYFFEFTTFEYQK